MRVLGCLLSQADSQLTDSDTEQGRLRRRIATLEAQALARNVPPVVVAAPPAVVAAPPAPRPPATAARVALMLQGFNAMAPEQQVRQPTRARTHAHVPSITALPPLPQDVLLGSLSQAAPAPPAA